MLVRLTQSFFYVPSRTMVRGSVVELPDEIAADWIQAELAVPIAAKTETATMPHYEEAVTPRRRAKR